MILVGFVRQQKKNPLKTDSQDFLIKWEILASERLLVTAQKSLFSYQIYQLMTDRQTDEVGLKLPKLELI